MKTSGHLVSNGGSRGHSAGEFFPFIVVAIGDSDSLKWYVQRPNGKVFIHAWDTPRQAAVAARLCYAVWCKR